MTEVIASAPLTECNTAKKVGKMPRNSSIQRIAMPALGALFVGFLSLSSTATASASDVGVTAPLPSDCGYGTWNRDGAWAACAHHNGGSYRAIAVCTHPETNKKYWYYGDWRQFAASYAYCQGSTKPTSAGIELVPTNKT